MREPIQNLIPLGPNKRQLCEIANLDLGIISFEQRRGRCRPFLRAQSALCGCGWLPAGLEKPFSKGAIWTVSMRQLLHKFILVGIN
jgi:hypothetical protein